MSSLSDYTVREMLTKTPSVLYSVKGEDPIILAGVHLSALDVEAVASLNKTGRTDGIILGYCVLRLINSANLWSVFYKTKVSTVKIPAFLVKPSENLQRMAQVILNKGWGYAVVVDAEDKPTNLIGLLDLSEFYLKSGFASRLADVHVGDKTSNQLFAISEDITVLDAIRMMLEKHVRRLYVKEPELILSDRGAIKWLLSPSNMTILRDTPKEVLSTRVSSLLGVLHTPSFVDPKTDGATALKLIAENDAHCVITKDLKHILTPWDLTVRLVLK